MSNSGKAHEYKRSSLSSGTLRVHSRACKNGLVGINSEVSYQLDHAPTGSPRF